MDEDGNGKIEWKEFLNKKGKELEKEKNQVQIIIINENEFISLFKK